MYNKLNNYNTTFSTGKQEQQLWGLWSTIIGSQFFLPSLEDSFVILNPFKT